MRWEAWMVAVVACWLSVVVCGGSNNNTRGVVEDIRRGEATLSVLEQDTTTTPSSGGQVVAPLMVGLTLISGADSKGAVCLDGTLPAYHIDRGSGSGEDSWLIQLEGGGWCNTLRSCVYRKTTRRGSSKFMEKQLAFTGILSNKAEENPDFYNWNRVKLRYCDGASFAGEGYDEASKLYFRGQRIWSVAMEALMAEGMQSATQALLSGCSAGGLASIIHCDEFRGLFPQSTQVKCLADAGMFMDAFDVSGGRALRDMYAGVVRLQDVQKNLPSICIGQQDPTLCFFPQNLVDGIKTPMFLLNAAYDVWQLQESLAPPSADPHGAWNKCKKNYAECNSSQIAFLQDFREQMLDSLKGFGTSDQNGLFINSCFAHCQSERQDIWFAADSPLIAKKRIAESVGDWYFDRAEVKAIDCPYPCDNSCRNMVFNDFIATIQLSRSSTLTFSLVNSLSSLLSLLVFRMF